MRELSSIQCVNCGTALELSRADAGGVFCPVCHLFNDFSEPVFELVLTADALEAQLGTVIAQARASGLPLDEIIRVLRDELEFAAELASDGRHLHVQIIDLGPLEARSMERPVRDRSSMLRGRAVGG
jgi:hypothetical protein